MSRFFLRHAVAASVVVGGCVALTVVVYLALLLWAIATNSGLGGPLALPGMIAVAFVASVAVVALVLLPVTAIADILCAKIRRFRWIAEIVVASIVLVIYVWTAVYGIGISRGARLVPAAQAGAVVSAVLLVLLGVYWWSSQATEMLLRIAVRAWQWIGHRGGPGRHIGKREHRG